MVGPAGFEPRLFHLTDVSLLIVLQQINIDITKFEVKRIECGSNE